MQHLLTSYQQLLAKVDQWFERCLTQHPQHMACRIGCSGCCRGLFDITLLDAALLQSGFAQLPVERQRQVRQRCVRRLEPLQQQWPEFRSPYVLNLLPHDDWQQMPEEDETPCVLLDEHGCCLLYHQRPLTCRLHGVPNVDSSGELLADSGCTLNFVTDSAVATVTRAPFRRLFTREAELIRRFNLHLTGENLDELDTFIPAALLIDFSSFVSRYRAAASAAC